MGALCFGLRTLVPLFHCSLLTEACRLGGPAWVVGGLSLGQSEGNSEHQWLQRCVCPATSTAWNNVQQLITAIGLHILLYRSILLLCYLHPLATCSKLLQRVPIKRQRSLSTTGNSHIECGFAVIVSRPSLVQSPMSPSGNTRGSQDAQT